MTEFDDRIQKLQDEIQRQRHLSAKLEELRIQYSDLKNKDAELMEILKKEQTDVEKIEGKSLTAMLCMLTGKKEERLSKEQKEAYVAKIKYETVHQELLAISEDIEKIKTECASIGKLEQELFELIAKKKQVMEESNSDAAAEILKVENEIKNCSSQIKEIKESLTEGNKALELASEIEGELKSARGWGIYDTIGGGFLSTMIKHSHLDDAQEKICAFQLQLRKFKTELSDVTLGVNVNVNVDGFLRFADYFWDNIFVDAAVLNKINCGLNDIIAARKQIQSVLDKLSAMKQEYERAVKNKREQLDKLIVNA